MFAPDHIYGDNDIKIEIQAHVSRNTKPVYSSTSRLRFTSQRLLMMIISRNKILLSTAETSKEYTVSKATVLFAMRHRKAGAVQVDISDDFNCISE